MNRRQLLTYGAFGLGGAAFAPGLAWNRPLAARGQGDRGQIEQIVIHPAIGVARVGNSPHEWFLGPETPGPHPVPPGGFKDAAGRIKRQAARFRLYGLDGDGAGRRRGDGRRRRHPLDASISPTRKPPGTTSILLSTSPRPRASPPRRCKPRQIRPALSAATRQSPIAPACGLTPGHARSPGRTRMPTEQMPAPGSTAAGSSAAEVPLGELRTDADGRLLVFGGMGQSGPAVPGMIAVTFANNDLWYDDTSDGPVEATVRIDGREIPVTGAWVVVAPPNYAPGIQSVVTMYDVIFEAATYLTPELRPARPSFTRMIYPLFERLVQNQWVNAGFLRDFGWGSPSDFLAPGHPAVAGQRGPGAGAAAAADLRALSQSVLYQHGIRRSPALLRRWGRPAGDEPAAMDGGAADPVRLAAAVGQRRFRRRLAGRRPDVSRQRSTICRSPSSRRRSTARRWTNASAARSIPAAR